jgi:hypothetical protein
MPESIWRLRGYFDVRTYIAMSIAEKYTLFHIFFLNRGCLVNVKVLLDHGEHKAPLYPHCHTLTDTPETTPSITAYMYRVPGFLFSRPN